MSMNEMFVMDEELAGQVEAAQPLTIAPPGIYPLQITGFVPVKGTEDQIFREKQGGFKYLLIELEIVDVAGAEGYKPFTHFFDLPDKRYAEMELKPREGEEDSKKKKRTRADIVNWHYNVFMDAIDLNPRQWIPADMIGRKFFAQVGVKADDGYGEKNKIDKILTPQNAQVAMSQTDEIETEVAEGRGRV